MSSFVVAATSRVHSSLGHDAASTVASTSAPLRYEVEEVQRHASAWARKHKLTQADSSRCDTFEHSRNLDLLLKTESKYSKFGSIRRATSMDY
jgi:hypothetical protein